MRLHQEHKFKEALIAETPKLFLTKKFILSLIMDGRLQTIMGEPTGKMYITQFL